MRPLLLPLSLISFTVLCLSILHLENIDTLEDTSNSIQKKYKAYQLKTNMEYQNQIEEEIYERQ